MTLAAPLRSLITALACTLTAAVPCAAQTEARLHARVVDQAGGAIVGATVTAKGAVASAPIVVSTNARGEFELALEHRPYTLVISAPGFAVLTEVLDAGAVNTRGNVFALQVASVAEAVTVDGGPAAAAVRSATKTPTPLRDIPQAIAVVSATTIADQRMHSMADVLRYMPGVGVAQGEGNRDTPVLRGNITTGDFFVDGVRDDAQYLRDTYNVERIEAIKGANAMIFGRGGAGGVINRVTREAGWSPVRQFDAQLGSWGNRRVAADLGGAPSSTLAARITTMYESSDSYRAGFALERAGINPTVAFVLGANTTLRASYEFFRDHRTADRGIPSVNGRPVDTDPSTFFGSADVNTSRADVNIASVLLEHNLRLGASIRSRTTFGDYDKFYRNLVPGAVNGANVSISGYDHRANRQNLFHQTDLIVNTQTGHIGHVLAAGVEAGRQLTSNFRNTAFFPTLGPNVTTTTVPLMNPRMLLPLEFRQNATDADNTGRATVAAAYVQDQISLTKSLRAVVGLRADQFDVNLDNHRAGVTLVSHDRLLSPRAGVIYKPTVPVSIYASYSVAYVPRAGDQLGSLSLTTQALEPETFRNREIGAKWDNGLMAVAVAGYRLDRGNVAVADPLDVTRTLLVDAQRTRGIELSIDGRITPSWTVNGGYAFQDGQITRSISASAQAGAILAHVPRHSASFWSKYDVSSRISAGIGVIHRGEIFAATDNLVTLPAFARADAALFWNASRKARVQVNIENLLNARYFASAHNNTNILPGSPRSVRIALTTRF